MVKGVSKQVIVLHSPDKELFDQAIFILKDSAVGKGFTEEALMKEAQRIIKYPGRGYSRDFGAFWACGGAAAMGFVWLLTVVL